MSIPINVFTGALQGAISAIDSLFTSDADQLSLHQQVAQKGFGNNLAKARNALQMTQETLARVSGISRATIALIESGNGDPKLSTIVSLASALRIAPALLLLDATSIEQTDLLFQELKDGGGNSISTEMIQDKIMETEFLKLQKPFHSSEDLRRMPGMLTGAAIGASLLPGIGAAIGLMIGWAMGRGVGSESNKDKSSE